MYMSKCRKSVLAILFIISSFTMPMITRAGVDAFDRDSYCWSRPIGISIAFDF